MEQAFQITILCVVGAVLTLVVKRSTPEVALLLTLATVAIVLVSVMGSVRELMLFLAELSERSGVSPELFLPLYKTIGIALVVKIGSGLCRDAGESALAAAVEMGGTICALLVALPLLRAVLLLLLELME